MKINNLLLLLFIFSMLSACNSTAQDYSVNIDVPVYVDAIDTSASPASPRLKINAFDKAPFATVKAPYLETIRKVEAMPEDQLCTQATQDLYTRAINLNQSSIYFKYMLLSCQEHLIDDASYQLVLEEISELALILLESGSGESIETAIKLREIAEATVILQLAGLTQLDAEIIANKGRFYYKFHVFDNVNKKFVYRYISNFEFLRDIYASVLNKPVDNKTLTELFMVDLSRNKAPVSVPFVLKGMAYTNEHQAVVTRADTFNITPLASVLIAESALVMQDDVLLDSLLDTMVSFADQGLLEAHNLITLFLFIKDGENSWATVQSRLEDADQRSAAGMGIELLLDSLLRRPDYQQQLKRFIDLTIKNSRKTQASEQSSASAKNYLTMERLVQELSDFQLYLQSQTTNSMYKFNKQIQETKSLLADVKKEMAEIQNGSL